MPTRRTTIILDDESGAAARQLAEHYSCPVSEAIRRSLVAQRDSIKGVSKRIRRQRVTTLEHLVELFEGNDANEEVRRLKREDESF